MLFQSQLFMCWSVRISWSKGVTWFQLCAGISVGGTWSALCPTPAPARKDTPDTAVTLVSGREFWWTVTCLFCSHIQGKQTSESPARCRSTLPVKSPLRILADLSRRLISLPLFFPLSRVSTRLQEPGEVCETQRVWMSRGLQWAHLWGR